MIKIHLINKVALIIDQVKEPATEDSYTKEQAFNRIVEEFHSLGVFG